MKRNKSKKEDVEYKLLELSNLEYYIQYDINIKMYKIIFLFQIKNFWKNSNILY